MIKEESSDDFFEDIVMEIKVEEAKFQEVTEFNVRVNIFAIWTCFRNLKLKFQIQKSLKEPEENSKTEGENIEENKIEKVNRREIRKEVAMATLDPNEQEMKVEDQ